MNAEEMFDNSIIASKKPSLSPLIRAHIYNALVAEGCIVDDVIYPELVKNFVLSGKIWTTRHCGPVGIKDLCRWLEVRELK